MLISYVLGGGLHGHGMDELAQRWLGHQPISFKSVAGTGKAQKSFRHVELGAATSYAAEDADITMRLYRLLRPRLAREGLLTVYETLERPLPAVLAAMELAGIRIDPDRLRLLSNDFSVRMADCEAEAPAAGRPAVQPRQPQADRRRAVRRDGPAGRQEDRHRRLVDRRLGARRAGRRGPRRCRACCSTGASCRS